jgi:hypothetical protein
MVDEVLVDTDRRTGAPEWPRFDKMGGVLRAGSTDCSSRLGRSELRRFVHMPLSQFSRVSAARNLKISMTQDATIP